MIYCHDQLKLKWRRILVMKLYSSHKVYLLSKNDIMGSSF